LTGGVQAPEAPGARAPSGPAPSPLYRRYPIAAGAVLVALLFAASQGGFGRLDHPVEGTRLFEIAALLACVLLLRTAQAPARWSWFVGSVLAVGTVSSALGAYPALSMKEVLLWTLILIAAPRLAALRRGALLGLGTALVTLQIIWTFDLISFWAQPHLMGDAFEPEAFVPLEAFSLFGHGRFLNQFQSWMLPAACLLCLRLRARPWVKAACWALLVVSWSQLWLSMGRGSMIGLTAGGVVVALLLGWPGRRFALLQAGLAVAGLALHTLFFRLLSREGTFESVIGRPATTTGRTPAWERAWEMFLESPVFGHGPQSFAWEGIRFGHPHSTPLQILAEWGLAGAALIAVGVGVGLVTIVRLRRSGHFRLAREGWLIALVYGSVAAATHSLVSGVAVFPLSHLGGLIVLALWFRVAGMPRGPTALAPGAVVGVALALLVAAGLLFPDAVLDFFGPLALDLDSMETQSFRRPRFWRDGL